MGNGNLSLIKIQVLNNLINTYSCATIIFFVIKGSFRRGCDYMKVGILDNLIGNFIK